MAKITIDGKDVEISNESMAELRASLLPNGEQLIRDLEPGEYEICGKGFKISKKSIRSDTDISTIPEKGNYFSWISGCSDEWKSRRDFERCIGMKIADLRQHHIKPYEVEWRDMTRNEILAFIAYYAKKIVARFTENNWMHKYYHTFDTTRRYEFAHITSDGTIGEAHKFRCTVDAPHKVEGTDYEF